MRTCLMIFTLNPGLYSKNKKTKKNQNLFHNAQADTCPCLTNLINKQAIQGVFFSSCSNAHCQLKERGMAAPCWLVPFVGFHIPVFQHYTVTLNNTGKAAACHGADKACSANTPHVKWINGHLVPNQSGQGVNVQDVVVPVTAALNGPSRRATPLVVHQKLDKVGALDVLGAAAIKQEPQNAVHQRNKLRHGMLPVEHAVYHWQAHAHTTPALSLCFRKMRTGRPKSFETERGQDQAVAAISILLLKCWAEHTEEGKACNPSLTTPYVPESQIPETTQ
eukprot:1149653-Pelagomonas_calceolata.AAC.3